MATRCWRALAGQFIPPIATHSLPASLLERLTGVGLSERLAQLLMAISPVTTSSSSLRVSLDPQTM